MGVAALIIARKHNVFNIALRRISNNRNHKNNDDVVTDSFVNVVIMTAPATDTTAGEER